MEIEERVEVIIVNAAQWQPTHKEFLCALAKLCKDDPVRCSIEEAQRDMQQRDLELHIGAVKARLLARHLLIEQLCNPAKRPLFQAAEKSQVLLANTMYGKPVTSFYQRGDFSISHEKKWVCCAFSASSPIGVDIALPQLSDPSLLPMMLSKTEIQLFQQQSRGKQVVLFAVFWSLKEAILEALGLGLSSNLQMSEICLNFDDDIPTLHVPELKVGQPCSTPIESMEVSLRTNTKQPWMYALAQIPGKDSHVFAVATPDTRSITRVEWQFKSFSTIFHS